MRTFIYLHENKAKLERLRTITVFPEVLGISSRVVIRDLRYLKLLSLVPGRLVNVVVGKCESAFVPEYNLLNRGFILSYIDHR